MIGFDGRLFKKGHLGFTFGFGAFYPDLVAFLLGFQGGFMGLAPGFNLQVLASGKAFSPRVGDLPFREALCCGFFSFGTLVCVQDSSSLLSWFGSFPPLKGWRALWPNARGETL